MEIVYTDSFYKSLKRLAWQQSFIYKSYALFRYDIPRFIKNIWLFRKGLWKYEWFDYTYNLILFKRSLEITCENLEKYGHEVNEHRLLKIQKMKRVIELLDNHIKDNYFERIKNKYNVDIEKFSDEHFKEVRELENKEWFEIWEIIRITDSYNKFNELYKKGSDINWEDYFDGSDMRGWWD